VLRGWRHLRVSAASENSPATKRDKEARIMAEKKMHIDNGDACVALGMGLASHTK